MGSSSQERPRAATERSARVARIRARVRARRYILDADATAQALVEALGPPAGAVRPSVQSAGMPRLGNQVASPATGCAGRLYRFTM